MPLVTFDLNADPVTVRLPIVWRLGRLFNVVTSVKRARITDEMGFLALDIEGTTQEVAQAANYLRALGLLNHTGEALVPQSIADPENTVSRANTIDVKLSTNNPGQYDVPILFRLGKDFDIVVDIERAAFDAEDGGFIEVALSGPLGEIQRAIAYLHTTGLHVFPLQRSVTDYSNL